MISLEYYNECPKELTKICYHFYEYYIWIVSYTRWLECSGILCAMKSTGDSYVSGKRQESLNSRPLSRIDLTSAPSLFSSRFAFVRTLRFSLFLPLLLLGKPSRSLGIEETLFMIFLVHSGVGSGGSSFTENNIARFFERSVAPFTGTEIDEFLVGAGTCILW